MWHAKPYGGYAIDSTEAKDNMDEIYAQLHNEGWTIEAICGMLGNMVAESGLNPWRWQDDSVSLTSDLKGYGLPQFTPAYGYIYDYGVGVTGYSPNLSVTEETSGATPEDGYAQIIVINEDKAGKFINRTSYCKYLDISSTYPLSDYKVNSDLWVTTVGWLFNYEFPANRSYKVAEGRYANAVSCYNYLSGQQPDPPPPKPPDPPKPPTPPTPTKRQTMPVWMICHKWD